MRERESAWVLVLRGGARDHEKSRQEKGAGVRGGEWGGGGRAGDET